MSNGYSRVFSRVGVDGIEYEDPIRCLQCGTYYDARFWSAREIVESANYVHWAVVCPEGHVYYQPGRGKPDLTALAWPPEYVLGPLR